MKYYFKVNFLETRKYTDYFLKLISSTVFINNSVASVSFNINDPMIKEISSTLKELQLPMIGQFIFFKHHRNQDIHKEDIRCSLNLPLIGYENSLMHFYQINALPIKKKSAYYYKETDEKTIIETLPGTNEWVLVDSSVPHCIVNSDFNNPRCTIALRFLGNPTLEELKFKIEQLQQH